jgi:pyruvate dehydrogenase E2 component (dihydrolipoamide acetyltransferase)
MATHVFKFPDVGEGIHEANLVEWLVGVGDAVTEDQMVAKVETDKAVVDIPTPVTGTIKELHGAEGELIFVGNPLVTFEVAGAGNAEDSAPAEAAPAAPAATEASAATPQAAAAPVPAGRRPQDVPATPHTRALARKLGVDITTVGGTGRNGRVTDEDVERAAAGGVATTQAVAAPTPVAPAPVAAAPAKAPAASAASLTVEATGDGPVIREPMSFLRRKIAEQMRLSATQLVHVTHVEEADVTDLFSTYREAKKVLAEQDVKLTPLPYFVKATVAALKKFPIFNATVDMEQGEITYKKFYNIGIAVDTENGLVVPVLKNAEMKNVAELAGEIRDKAKRARTRELGLDEMRGGTFTITNIGPVGGVHATPIINYPEIAILALHAIEDRPAVVDGEIVVRKKMYLSISFDHQVIDGADAARFMRTIRSMLENPTYLFTQI